MDNINKLADILNADAIFINVKTKKGKFLQCNFVNTSSKTLNFLITHAELLSRHTYQSLNYNLGHILTCHVDDDTIICFSFNYNNPLSNNSELMMIQSLSNLKTIAQIIYSLYNVSESPDVPVMITNLTDNKEISKNTPRPFEPNKFFNTETEIIKAIIYSNKKELITSLNKLSQIQLIGERFASNNIIRGEKDTIISYVAVLNRAIIQWGYPVDLAFQLHNELVQEIELSPQFLDFFQVIREITWHYYKIIKNYRMTNFLPLHKRIKQYIKEHITDNITLDDIATALNTSKKTLNPAFKNEYNVTITQFIRQTKIDTAKELLIASDLTLMEISSLLSFSTTSYFIKTFKKVTGITPNYFRQHFFDHHLHL